MQLLVARHRLRNFSRISLEMRPFIYWLHPYGMQKKGCEGIALLQSDTSLRDVGYRSFPICQEFHLSRKMDCTYKHYCTN